MKTGFNLYSKTDVNEEGQSFNIVTSDPENEILKNIDINKYTDVYLYAEPKDKDSNPLIIAFSQFAKDNSLNFAPFFQAAFHTLTYKDPIQSIKVLLDAIRSLSYFIEKTFEFKGIDSSSIIKDVETYCFEKLQFYRLFDEYCHSKDAICSSRHIPEEYYTSSLTYDLFGINILLLDFIADFKSGSTYDELLNKHQFVSKKIFNSDINIMKSVMELVMNKMNDDLKNKKETMSSDIIDLILSKTNNN